MKPEVDQEIKDAMRIYKIAGPVIIIILLIGVLYAVFKPEAPAPIPQPIPQPTPEATPEAVPEPTLEPTPEATPAINVTPVNITANITANITQNVTLNASATATPTPTPQITNYTWEGIVVNFPDSMKRISTSQKSHHYIEILESDGTPVTNVEQFELDFNINDVLGRETEVIATFESNKWLVSLLLTNKGNYTFTVILDCEAQKGHCQRLYPPGTTQKSTTMEVV